MHKSFVSTKSKSVTFSPFKVIEPLPTNSLASLLLEQEPEVTSKSTIFKSSLTVNTSKPLNATSTSLEVNDLISPLNKDSLILTAQY